MLADNQTNDLAANDDAALLELLREIDGDLDGTAFTNDDLAELIASLETPDFDVDDDEDVRLDRKSVTTCPECGHTFTPVTRSVTDDDEL